MATQHNLSSLAEIAAILRPTRRVLAFCHVSPDGDALGALLALGWVLSGLKPEGSTETRHDSKSAATRCQPRSPSCCRGSDRILARHAGRAVGCGGWPRWTPAIHDGLGKPFRPGD